MRGFTMLEVTVVLGLAAVIGSLSLLASAGLYRQTTDRLDANEGLSVLRAARAAAQFGVCPNECSHVSIQIHDEPITFRLLSSLPIRATTVDLRADNVSPRRIVVGEAGSLSTEHHVPQ